MKKKLLIFGLIAVVLVSCAGLVIWQVTKPKAPIITTEVEVSEISANALAAPKIALKGNVITWDSITGASGYEVYINGALKETAKESGYLVDTDTIGQYSIKTKAVSNSDSSTASGFSNEVTYTVSEGGIDVHKLDAPVASMSGKMVRWNTVGNAVEYRVFVDGTEVAETSQTTYLFDKIVAGTYKITVTALNPSSNYTESNKSNEVKHTVDPLSFSKPILVKYTENNKKTFVLVPNNKGEMTSVNVKGITEFSPYTWYLEDAGNGAYYVKLNNGYYLTRFSNGENAPEAKAAVKVDGDLNQQWTFVFVSGNSYKIQNLGHIKDFGNYYYGEWYGVYKFADGVSPWTIENVDDTYVNITKLAAPVITADKMTVSWNAVPDATAYEVYVNGVLTDTVSELTYTVGGTDDVSVYVKAISSESGYESSYASNTVLCTNMFAKPLLAKYKENNGNICVMAPNEKGEMTAVNGNDITDFSPYTWYPEDAGNGAYYIKLYNGYYLTRFSNDNNAPEVKAAAKVEGNLDQQWKFVYVSGRSFKMQNVGHMKDWGNYYYGEWYGVYKFADGVNPWSFGTVDTPYPNLTKLAAPVVSSVRMTASWEAIPEATAYEVYVNGALTDTVTDLTYTVAGNDDVSVYVKAISSAADYESSFASNTVLCTNMFARPLLVKYTTNDGNTCVMTPDEKGEMVAVNVNGITDFAPYTWYFEEAGNGAYYVKLYNGYYLTRFSNGDSAPEVKAAAKVEGDANQQWKFEYVNNYSYKLQNVGHMNDWGNYYYGEWYGVYKFASGVNAWSFGNVGTIYPNITKLSAPAVSSVNMTVSWEAVPGATGYEVYVNGALAETVTGLTYTAPGTDDVTVYVKAISTANGYENSYISNKVSCTNMFAKPLLVKYTTNDGNTWVMTPNEKGEMVAINVNDITDFAPYTWYLEDTGSGSYYIKLYDGYYLTRFSNGDNAPEVKAAAKIDGNLDQQWKFVFVSGHSFKIQNVGHMNDWGNYYYGEWYGVYKFASGVNAWSFENVETPYPNITKLSAPVVSSINMTVSWGAVTGATGYEVYVNGTLTATVTDLTYTVAGTKDVSVYVKAISSANGYENSYISNVVSCTNVFAKPLLAKYTTNDGNTFVMVPNEKGEMVSVNGNGITDFAQYTWYLEDAGNGAYYIKLYSGLYLARFSNGDNAPEVKAAVKIEGNANQQWKFVYVRGNSYKIQNVGHMNDWGNYYYGEWYGVYKFADGVNAWSFENVETPYPNITKLSAPVVSSINMTVSWGAVTGATGYEVYVNGTLTATVTDLTYTVAGTEDVSVYVKAISSVNGYENSYISNVVSCTNVFAKPLLAKYTTNDGNTFVMVPNEKGEMVAVNVNGITDFAQYTWYLEDAGNGAYYIKLYSGLYLTRFSNGDNAPEVKAAVKVLGDANQQWKFVYVSGNSYKIQNVGHMNDWGNYYYGEWYGVYKFAGGVNAWSFENVETPYPFLINSVFSIKSVLCSKPLFVNYTTNDGNTNANVPYENSGFILPIIGSIFFLKKR